MKILQLRSSSTARFLSLGALHDLFHSRPARGDLPIHALKPYPNNPRTHSKRQIEQVAASIRTFGWTNPILVSDDLEIIAGHGRLEAAKSLGLGEVPVMRLSGMSEAQQRAYVIADNRLAETAGWMTIS
ncbi:MAG: ParB N-terminal domain-containing protein [Oceanicaulis sp.]|nr:ParB N-terminal domain-containing protein [Oceanicaulis sp.]